MAKKLNAIQLDYWEIIINCNQMKGQPARKPTPSSYLSQIRSPLAFFGMTLLVTESSFGAFLFRYPQSERIVSLTITWMGLLFIIAMIVVGFLTYKVPRHVMLEFQKTTAQDIAIKAATVREAVAIVLNFSKTDVEKDPDALLAMLAKVESILNRETSEQR